MKDYGTLAPFHITSLYCHVYILLAPYPSGGAGGLCQD